MVSSAETTAAISECHECVINYKAHTHMHIDAGTCTQTMAGGWLIQPEVVHQQCVRGLLWLDDDDDETVGAVIKKKED